MQTGDTVRYKGSALRASDGSTVEVDGTFTVGDKVSNDAGEHWRLADVRSDELPAEVDRELWAFLVPLDAQPSTD